MPRFARGALPWLLAPAFLAIALLVFLAVPGLRWVAWAALLPAFVFLFFLQFFRDPERPVADGIVSPADGVVVRIDQVEDADLGTVDRLAVFMSPTDVHVNRFPLDARVLEVRHVPGGHIPAFNKDAHRNERVEWLLETALGRIKVIQIAGTVARRIVPYLSGGEDVRKGDRMGLIRLGSRCDLLVPPGSVSWSVQLKQQVHGAMDRVGEVRRPAAAATANSKRKAGKGQASRQAGTKVGAKTSGKTSGNASGKTGGKASGKPGGKASGKPGGKRRQG